MKLYKNKDWLYQKYYEENLNSYDIAKLSNCCQRTILNWMEKFNISRKTLKDYSVNTLNWFINKFGEIEGKNEYKRRNDKISKKLSGESHPNFIDGRSIGYIEYYCIEPNCNNKVSGPNRRCNSCATKKDWKLNKYKYRKVNSWNKDFNTQEQHLNFFIKKYGYKNGIKNFKSYFENHNGKNNSSSHNEKLIRRFFQFYFKYDNWNCKQISRKMLNENYNYDHFIQPDMQSDIKNVIFEYDGPWHFKQIGSEFFHNLNDKKYRDIILEQYCLDNDIRLIRMSSTYFKKDKKESLKDLINAIYNPNEQVIKFGKEY